MQLRYLPSCYTQAMVSAAATAGGYKIRIKDGESMPGQNKKKLVNLKYTYVILKRFLFVTTVIIIIIAGLFLGKQYLQSRNIDCRYLNDGWQSRNADSLTLPLQLSTNSQEFVLSRRLGNDFSVKQTIAFFTKQEGVSVFLDNTCLYRSPAVKAGVPASATASRWNIITLPEQSQGKELSIMLKTSQTLSVFYCGSFIYGDGNDILKCILSFTIPSYVCSWILFVVGLALIVGCFILKKQQQMNGLEYLGISTLFFSVYTMCSGRLYGVFDSGAFTESLLCIAAFLFWYLPVLLYCKEIYPKRWERYLTGMAVCVTGLGLVLFILWLTGLLDFIIIVFVMLVVMAVCGIFLGVLAKGHRKLLIPTMVLTVCILLTAGLGLVARLESNTFFLAIGQIFYVAYMLTLTLQETMWAAGEKAVYQKQSEWLYNQMMTSQIKPHFMYNVLSSVRTLIKKDPETAYKMVYDFSHYLRASIDSIGNEQLIPFSQELKNIKAYLDIEQVRFADRFQVEYDIKADAFPIPMLTVEPLVENAVKHGLRSKREGGLITIRSYSLGGLSVVEVEDNGCGFDTGSLDQHRTSSAGVKNITSRLNYFGNYELHIQSEIGKGTTATILYIKERRERWD